MARGVYVLHRIRRRGGVPVLEVVGVTQIPVERTGGVVPMRVLNRDYLLLPGFWTCAVRRIHFLRRVPARPGQRRPGSAGERR